MFKLGDIGIVGGESARVGRRFVDSGSVLTVGLSGKMRPSIILPLSVSATVDTDVGPSWKVRNSDKISVGFGNSASCSKSATSSAFIAKLKSIVDLLLKHNPLRLSTLT